MTPVPMAAHTKIVNQPLAIQMQRLTDRYVWFDLSINRLMLASAADRTCYFGEAR